MPSCLHMIWIVLYGSISVHFSSVAADCYFPNGLLNELYQPCDRSNEHSMCCGTRELDRCRNDGLCFDAPNNDIWRGSCTDPTWKSPACIKLCVEGTGKLLIFVDVLVRRRRIRSRSRAPTCQHANMSSRPVWQSEGRERPTSYPVSGWKLLLWEGIRRLALLQSSKGRFCRQWHYHFDRSFSERPRKQNELHVIMVAAHISVFTVSHHNIASRSHQWSILTYSTLKLSIIPAPEAKLPRSHHRGHLRRCHRHPHLDRRYHLALPA